MRKFAIAIALLSTLALASCGGNTPEDAAKGFMTALIKGDVEKAKAVYKGFQPLVAEDIAEIVYFVATRPAHVCINDLIVTPTAQANTSHLLRKTE